MNRVDVIKAQQAAQNFIRVTDELLQAERSETFWGSVRRDDVLRKGRVLTRALAKMSKP